MILRVDPGLSLIHFETANEGFVGARPDLENAPFPSPVRETFVHPGGYPIPVHRPASPPPADEYVTRGQTFLCFISSCIENNETITRLVSTKCSLNDLQAFRKSVAGVDLDQNAFGRKRTKLLAKRRALLGRYTEMPDHLTDGHGPLFLGKQGQNRIGSEVWPVIFFHHQNIFTVRMQLGGKKDTKDSRSPIANSGIHFVGVNLVNVCDFFFGKLNAGEHVSEGGAGVDPEPLRQFV